MPQMSGSLRGCTILLVEDEYMIAMDMADQLRRAKAEVLGPVGHVDDALDLIEDHAGQVDAAVLDVNLGAGKTAYPIADRLQELGIPYLFATGDVQVLRKATGPILEKPVLEAKLLHALTTLLTPQAQS